MDSSSPCVYYSSYGDGTQSLGILATETINLPTSDATSKSLPSSVFGCGFDNKGQIGYQGEGIVGLGQGPASLISQLGSNINYKFSYCLAPLSSEVTSKLTFGADVTGSEVVSTPFTTANDNTFYYLSLNGITVGDQDNSVQVPTELDVIIDSGTTYTYLPSNIYESVKSTLETAIELTPVESPVESLDLCYDTTQLAGSGAQFNPPDMVFHFQGADVVLKALNTFRDVGDGVSCLAMVANNDQPYIFVRTPNDAKFSALSPSTGDYLIKISIGTPQVEFMAAADTGSDLIWIQCSPCESCLSTKSQPFNTKKSSTYNVIPCTSPTCKYIDLTSGCTTNKSSSPCVYYAIYGDGTQSVGFLATETISLPTSDATSKSLPSSIFGCGFVNQDQSFNQMDGIVGLGQGPASLISQLGPSINYKFSYCLASLSLNVTSKLTFGADVTGLGVVSTPFKSAKTPTFYILSLNGITIGDKDKDNSVQVPTNLDIIIDSGTTYTYLQSSIYESVKSAMKTAIGLTSVPCPIKSSLEHCYDTTQLSGSGAQFKPPDVVFHFQGGNVVLKALNTFRDMGHGVSCLAMVATNDTNIFGNIAQVNFEVGYDLQAKQVSFAPADCTNH
ncbi:hypothetical protein BVRB_6g149240 [Beta vulgaris subsp. vulgaris]|nr:hypothetical protein BVRB_6g149240 [Beta vulgaris subsp. vulgaris]